MLVLTWFGLISYLCFLANSLAIDIFTAYDTIAIDIESPTILVNIWSGGIIGLGILF